MCVCQCEIIFVLSYTCTISLRGIYEAIFNVTFPINLDSSKRNDGITKTTTSREQNGLLCAVGDEK